MHTVTPIPIAPPPDAGVDRLLRCVSSDYLSGGCPCQRTIPASFVSAAWARELERTSGPRRDGFFQFTWRAGQWLSYGLSDGRVRGVYCPEHSAARTERSGEREETGRETRVACAAS